jgi:WD40 repeat protein
LFRTAAPDFTPERVLQDVNDGIVMFSGGQMNIVGKQWWVGKLTDEKLTCAGDVPWTYWNRFGPAAELDLTQQYYLLRQVFHSNTYGLVACYYDPVSNEQIIARVVFENTGKAARSSDETVTSGSAAKVEPTVTRSEIRRQPVSRFYAASGSAASRTLRQHVVSLNTLLALSADGKTLVTGPSPQVWNASEGRFRGSFFINGEVKALSLSGDGHWLAAGTRSGDVRIWQMSTLDPARVLAAHAGRVLNMEFSADSKWLATISGERSLRLWDVKTATEVFHLPLQHTGSKKVAFSPDGRLLAASGGRGTEFYDVQTGICNHRTETLATLFGFISDGSAVGIAADGTGSLIAWDPRTRVSRKLLSSPGGEVMAVARSGNCVAVRELGTLEEDRIANSKRLVVWDLGTASKVELASPPVNVTVAAVFSLNGITLAVASEGGHVRLWNPSTGREFIPSAQTPQGSKK